MNASKSRAVCYTIEGLNSFATVIFFNYLYFLLRDRFGFNDKQNLALASLIGLIYMFAAWQAGGFAQRCGYFTALKTGFGIMAAGLVVGSRLHSAGRRDRRRHGRQHRHVLHLADAGGAGQRGRNAARLPRAIGIYNIVWAVTNAAAYFIGGTLDRDSSASRVMFYLPLAIMLVQLALVFWLQKHATRLPALPPTEKP